MHGASRSDRLVELFGEGAELDESGRRALVDRIRGEDPALADDLAGLLEVNARTEQRPLENIVVQALARKIAEMEKQMYRHAENLEFEEAARVRDDVRRLREVGLKTVAGEVEA